MFFLYQAYLSEDIRRELGLHREELVALAYFLGCDYTDGVTGVGIVNALEIVQAFPMRSQSDTTSISNNDNDINCVDNVDNNNNNNNSSDGNNRDNLHNIDKQSHGHYPVVGLLKFKDWLEGYDFRETIIAQKSKSKSKSKEQNFDKKSDADKNQISKKIKNKIKRKQTSKLVKKRKFDNECSSNSDSESDTNADGDDDEDLFSLPKVDQLKRKTLNENNENKNNSKKKAKKECGVDSESDCETSSDNEDDRSVIDRKGKSTGINKMDHDTNSSSTSKNHGSEEQNTDNAPDLATRLVNSFQIEIR